MNYLLVTVAAASFLLYGHAIQRTFSRSQGVDIRMRCLQIGGILFAWIHCWILVKIASQMTIRGTIALALYLGGIGTFFAAKKAIQGYRLTLAFSPDIPNQIIQAGIYSRVRHPFYMAYSLTWIGGVVATGSALTTTTACLMIGAYLLAARYEERKFMLSALGPAYEDYRTRASMIWPKLFA